MRDGDGAGGRKKITQISAAILWISGALSVVSLTLIHISCQTRAGGPHTGSGMSRQTGLKDGTLEVGVEEAKQTQKAKEAAGSGAQQQLHGDSSDGVSSGLPGSKP